MGSSKSQSVSIKVLDNEFVRTPCCLGEFHLHVNLVLYLIPHRLHIWNIEVDYVARISSLEIYNLSNTKIGTPFELVGLPPGWLLVAVRYEAEYSLVEPPCLGQIRDCDSHTLDLRFSCSSSRHLPYGSISHNVSQIYEVPKAFGRNEVKPYICCWASV